MKNKKLSFIVGILLCAFFFLSVPAFASLEEIKTAILKEDYQAAKTLSETALAGSSLGSSEEVVLYYLALSQLYLGQAEKARGNFQKVVDTTKDMDLSDQASIGIVSSYYLDGDYRASLKRAQQLLSQHPNSNYASVIYLKIARADLKLRNWEPARRFLLKVVNDFPDSLEAYTAAKLLEEKQFFTVQVGAFLDRDRALSVIEELRSQGHYGYIVETKDQEGKIFYRVRVGELSSLNSAEKLKEKLSTLGYPTLIYP